MNAHGFPCHLPAGTMIAHDELLAHPADDHGGHTYRLLLFGRTDIYRLQAMDGSIRSCPQPWAREIGEAEKTC